MRDAPDFGQVLPTDAAVRKAIPLQAGLFDYFPDALCAVAVLSRVGNDQHNLGEPVHWERGKSMDQGDALIRHQMQRGLIDNDKVRHSTKVAWRALAQLQLELEAARDDNELLEPKPELSVYRYGTDASDLTKDK